MQQNSNKRATTHLVTFVSFLLLVGLTWRGKISQRIDMVILFIQRTLQITSNFWTMVMSFSTANLPLLI